MRSLKNILDYHGKEGDEITGIGISETVIITKDGAKSFFNIPRDIILK